MGVNRRALITGIHGFTGGYVRKELEASGWDVFGIGIHEELDDKSYQQVDLLDSEKLFSIIKSIQPDAVLHLAGAAFVGHGNADDFYMVNVLGTRHLLAALSENDKKPGCVLLASSANIYGNQREGVILESTPANPVNDYAVSKYAMECMARLWMDKLPIVIVRPFNYTGVGQSESFLLPKIVAHFRSKAEAIELGNLDVWRDFSDVRAVAYAYRRLIEVTPVGEIINVCSGRTNSLREAISLAEEICGHKISVNVNPAFVRHNEVKTLCGDPTKLRSLIGSWDTPPLKETLRWMLDE